MTEIESSSRGFCTIARIRRVEREALARLPAGTLMARAAAAVAHEAERILRGMPPASTVIALAGPGANGADALLAALILNERGYAVQGCCLVTALPADRDARAVHERWHSVHGPPLSLAQLTAIDARQPVLVLDGLFGIGLARPLAGEALAALVQVDARGWPVLAVDVPSGIDADTGAVVGGANGSALRARATVTMIADKPGLHTGAGLAHAGRVHVATLGLHLTAADGIAIDRDWVRTRLRPRAPDTHKGSFGTAMVLGGAAGMEGAALLAARAAQAIGAGKVIVASPEVRPFDPAQPQLMSRHLGSRPAASAFAGVTAMAIGCGLGLSTAAGAWLGAALESTIALVLDADALNQCARDAALAAKLEQRQAQATSVLTPHPLEAARLLGTTTAAVQGNRLAAAQALATRFGCQVLLKGAGTVLASPGGRWGIVRAGGPALASAGTGDVLAGAVAGLLCQRHCGLEAAAIGAWVHGAAGDLWSARHPQQRGLSAAALSSLLTEAINAFS